MKIRDLEKQLRQAGFIESRKKGKGSHRKWFHKKLGRPLLIAGKSKDDAKPYQIDQIEKAIEFIKRK